jgi:hypothetical protein
MALVWTSNAISKPPDWTQLVRPMRKCSLTGTSLTTAFRHASQAQWATRKNSMETWCLDMNSRLELLHHKSQWFSGKIRACHARAPCSIHGCDNLLSDLSPHPFCSARIDGRHSYRAPQDGSCLLDLALIHMSCSFAEKRQNESDL